MNYKSISIGQIVEENNEVVTHARGTNVTNKHIRKILHGLKI